nr:flotillin family protein [Leucobacter chinensis]
MSPIIAIVGAVLAVTLVALVIIKRYRIAKPDEAIIVTGRRGHNATPGAEGDLSGQKVVTGGGVFVLPFIQKSYSLSLHSRRLSILTEAQTTDGITIQGQAVAVVKVGGSQEMIRAAAQRFLSNADEIDQSTQEVLSGSLRSIIGGLTVMQIIRDRAVVAQNVLEAAEEALTKQGLVVDTLQIQEIRDGADYIANIGRPEAAKVRQAADIADTNAYQASEEAKIGAQKVLLDRNRELKLREAEILAETDRAAAHARAASPLEDAVQRQAIVEQEQIAAQREVKLKEERLNAEVRVVAEAEAFKVEALAKAEAAASVAAAEGRARATTVEGEAEASAIHAKGIAEAQAINARAEALEQQSQAVLAQELIHLLPEIAAEYSKAIGAIDTMTVVSADGTSKVASDAMGNMKGLLDMARDTVGIDLVGMLNGVVTGGAAGSAAGKQLRTEGSVLTGDTGAHGQVATSEVSPAATGAAGAARETSPTTDAARAAVNDTAGNPASE